MPLTNDKRDLDEKAAIQRRKEEEAEAKLQAKKAGLGSRLPDRSAPVREVTRTDSSERPSGPPRLALAGNKPSWRERQAAKEAAEAGGATAPAPAPSAADTSEEPAAPKRTGYVPPGARRTDDRGSFAPSRGRPEAGTAPALGRDGSSGAEPTPRWRPGASRGDLGRDDSPAERRAPRMLDSLKAPSGGANASLADGVRPTSSSGESPAPEARKPAAGKYVPVHLRNK